jgi:hypothetical protein
LTTADEYRIQAARFSAMAKQATNPHARAEWDTIAKAYLRLAQLADRNAQTNVWYETPGTVTMQQPEQQQQAKNDDPES